MKEFIQNVCMLILVAGGLIFGLMGIGGFFGMDLNILQVISNGSIVFTNTTYLVFGLAAILYAILNLN